MPEGCQKAARMLAKSFKCFLNSAGMLSLGHACRMLADSVRQHDCRMLRECWQNYALLLSDASIACQKAAGMLIECYPNPGMPLAECDQNPELLRVHSARPIWMHSACAREGFGHVLDTCFTFFDSVSTRNIFSDTRNAFRHSLIHLDTLSETVRILQFWTNQLGSFDTQT